MEVLGGGQVLMGEVPDGDGQGPGGLPARRSALDFTCKGFEINTFWQ